MNNFKFTSFKIIPNKPLKSLITKPFPWEKSNSTEPQSRMDASKLYKTQLLFLKFFGFPLDYQNGWKGKLKKFYAVCVVISNLIASSVMFHYIALGNYTIEEFSDAFGCFYAISESFLKLIVFHICRHKFKKLFNDMETILKCGTSMSAYSLQKITNIGQNLTKMYLIPAVLTSETYIFGGLYKTLIKSCKVLPFKAR